MNKNNKDVKTSKIEISRKKLKKIKKSINILSNVLIIIISIIFVLSGYKIVTWHMDNKETKEIEEEIENITTITEVEDNENTEVVNEPKDEFDLYWDYIKIPLMNVDFNELLQKNNDTVGWIFVNNTNINYPVVQTDDNSYYLNVSFEDKYSDAGWIFMDYRNDSNLSDRNTIIYGHSRKDMSLFGTLRNVVKKSWYNDNDNYIVKFSTPKENTLWQVFSTYTIEAESYYIKTDFSSDTEYERWLNDMLNRSVFDYKTSVNKDDKVLTLSSCYTSDGIRVVLHAKLIKKETR